MKILVTVMLLGFGLSVLSGCGQKGDLYLPEIPPAPNVEAQSTPYEMSDTELPIQDQQNSKKQKKSKAQDSSLKENDK